MPRFSPIGLGNGLSVANAKYRMMNRSGVTFLRGEAAVVDFTTADETVIADYNTGRDTDALGSVVGALASNVTMVGAAMCQAAIVMIADADVLNDEVGDFWLSGASVFALTGTCIPGDVLVLATGGGTVGLTTGVVWLATAVIGHSAKVVGLTAHADEEGDLGNNETLIMFDGYNGYGTIHEDTA